MPSDTVSLSKGNESSATPLRQPQIVHRPMVFRYDVATGLADQNTGTQMPQT